MQGFATAFRDSLVPQGSSVSVKNGSQEQKLVYETDFVLRGDPLRTDATVTGPVDRAVVGAGATVRGAVTRGVIWPGGTVEAGEHLVDAIRVGRDLTVPAALA